MFPIFDPGPARMNFRRLSASLIAALLLRDLPEEPSLAELRLRHIRRVILPQMQALSGQIADLLETWEQTKPD